MHLLKSPTRDSADLQPKGKVPPRKGKKKIHRNQETIQGYSNKDSIIPSAPMALYSLQSAFLCIINPFISLYKAAGGGGQT